MASGFLDEPISSALSFSGQTVFNGAGIADDLLCQQTTFGDKASFIGVRVGGQAQWSRATFTRLAEADGMHVGDDFFCDEATFKGNASFTGVHVGGQAQWSRVTFQQRLVADDMEVDEDLFCDRAIFGGSVSFIGAGIGGEARFSGAAFHGKADFTGARVGEARFTKATFAENATFRFLRAGGGLSCRMTTFRSAARFTGAALEQGIVARGCEFTGPADFHLATIRLKARFQDCVFHRIANFSGASIEGEMDCRSATFEDKWDLTGARITILLVDNALGEKVPSHTMERFRGPTARVDLRGCKFDQIQVYLISFLEHQDPLDSRPYAEFERTMRRMGRDDFADAVYYRRRQREGNAISIRGTWFWSEGFWGNVLRFIGDRFLRAVAGYGVHPWRMLGFMVLFPILGCIAFHSPRAVRPVAKSDVASTASEHEPSNCHNLSWEDAAWLSLRIYLPFDIPSAGTCVPSDSLLQLSGANTSFPLRASSLGTILRIAGWIFIPTAAATFTGLLRYAGGRD